MARRAVNESVILKEAWQTFFNRGSYSLFLNEQKFLTPDLRVRSFCSGRRIDLTNNCSNNENLSSSSSVVSEKMHESAQKVGLQSISDTSKTECKVGQTTNKVFGSTVIDGSTGEWLTLNQELNTYPTVRRFTAIGLGGDDFVQSMVLAVESVIQQSIPQDFVKQRVSSGGKYVSVNIGPVRVVSSEQVRDVYNAMRSDNRMKFFL